MRTDRELLESAAKAYFGAGNFEWNSCAGFAGAIQYIPTGGSRYVDWNPKDDDGDSQRLANRLCMTVSSGPCRASATTIGGALRGFFPKADVTRGDQNEAVRAVILLAAAEVGRAMP